MSSVRHIALGATRSRVPSKTVKRNPSASNLARVPSGSSARSKDSRTLFLGDKSLSVSSRRSQSESRVSSSTSSPLSKAKGDKSRNSPGERLADYHRDEREEAETLRAELSEIDRLYREELEKHKQTQQEMEMLAQKSVEQRVQDETLALRISECMQRMFAAEEAHLNTSRQKDLLACQLRDAKAEMAEKQKEAQEIGSSLKTMNEQLIESVEEERESAKQARQELADARSQADAAAELLSAREKEAQVSADHVRDRDSTIALLRASAEEEKKKRHEVEVREAVASHASQRLVSDLKAQASLLREREASRDTLAQQNQDKECTIIRMQGELSALQSKCQLLEQNSQQTNRISLRCSDMEDSLSATKKELAETKAKLSAATSLAEEFMARAETAEAQIEPLQQSLRDAEMQVKGLVEAASASAGELNKCRLVENHHMDQYAQVKQSQQQLLTHIRELETEKSAAAAEHAEQVRSKDERIASLEKEREQLLADKQQMLENMDKLTSNLLLLQDANSAHESAQASMAQQLEEARVAAAQGNGWRTECDALRVQLEDALLSCEEFVQQQQVTEEINGHVLGLVTGLLDTPKLLAPAKNQGQAASYGMNSQGRSVNRGLEQARNSREQLLNLSEMAPSQSLKSPDSGCDASLSSPARHLKRMQEANDDGFPSKLLEKHPSLEPIKMSPIAVASATAAAGRTREDGFRRARVVEKGESLDGLDLKGERLDTRVKSCKGDRLDGLDLVGTDLLSRVSAQTPSSVARILKVIASRAHGPGERRGVNLEQRGKAMDCLPKAQQAQQAPQGWQGTHAAYEVSRFGTQMTRGEFGQRVGVKMDPYD